MRRPAVWGDAIEVPEMMLVAVSDPTQVEKMFKPRQRRVRLLVLRHQIKHSPGAKVSMHLPWLEK